MSLDVYLSIPNKTQIVGARIMIREDGQNKELSLDEWNARYPDREPYMTTERQTDTIYGANITHNLGGMAREAGIYEAMWKPDKIGITHASQLIDPLRTGLALLMREPDRFKVFDPSNGWGDYEGLVRFVNDYLQACEENPEAEVRVSR